MNDWPEPEGPQRMRHIQRQQPPVRQPGPPRPPADPPVRQPGYGVPPQQAQSPGGYDSKTFATTQWAASEDMNMDVGLAVVAPLNGQKL
ncbi:hypothetical protein AB0N28_18720, partial [Streptomyces sp. NPDC051130]